jgi:hypothetical protein
MLRYVGKHINEREFLKYRLDKYVCKKVIDKVFTYKYLLVVVRSGVEIEINVISNEAKTHSSGWVEACGDPKVIEKQLVEAEEYPSGSAYLWYERIRLNSGDVVSVYYCNCLSGYTDRWLLVGIPDDVYEKIKAKEEVRGVVEKRS